MNLLIVSTAPLIKHDNGYLAYSPYVNELNIWAENASQLTFCCPVWAESNGLLSTAARFKIAKVFPIRETNITTFRNAMAALFALPYNLRLLYAAMSEADHIHLRCPGNVGLLGCFVQMLFPKKPKTAKYAGNWDPKAVQPLSYKLQKWMLSNTFLTRNMAVLVYGDWPLQSDNIKPFFTATYSEAEKTNINPRPLQGQINMLFVGTLSLGKRPLYAVQIAQKLREAGLDIELIIFGEGTERSNIQRYLTENQLTDHVFLRGNQDPETIKTAYQNSHFVILPSVSEGWPKAVAEAMFWGCVPISTAVSCVPNMLGEGQRGIILTNDIDADVLQIVNLLKDEVRYDKMAASSMEWSRLYTTDFFKDEIHNLLIQGS